MGLDITTIKNGSLKAAAQQIDNKGNHNGIIDGSEITIFNASLNNFLKTNQGPKDEIMSILDYLKEKTVKATDPPKASPQNENKLDENKKNAYINAHQPVMRSGNSSSHRRRVNQFNADKKLVEGLKNVEYFNYTEPKNKEKSVKDGHKVIQNLLDYTSSEEQQEVRHIVKNVKSEDILEFIAGTNATYYEPFCTQLSGEYDFPDKYELIKNVCDKSLERAEKLGFKNTPQYKDLKTSLDKGYNQNKDYSYIVDKNLNDILRLYKACIDISEKK